MVPLFFVWLVKRGVHEVYVGGYRHRVLVRYVHRVPCAPRPRESVFTRVAAGTRAQAAIAQRGAGTGRGIGAVQGRGPVE